MRYEGAVHAAGLMWREEGFRGLYRGYVAFMMATAIYWAVVPLVAELAMTKQPVSGNYRDKTNELLDEVHNLDRVRNEAVASASSRKSKRED